MNNAVYSRRPKSIPVLQQVCRVEWHKIHKARTERHLSDYRARLKSVIAAKGGVTKYWQTGCQMFLFFQYVKFSKYTVIVL